MEHHNGAINDQDHYIGIDFGTGSARACIIRQHWQYQKSCRGANRSLAAGSWALCAFNAKPNKKHMLIMSIGAIDNEHLALNLYLR
jgi:hypothetical protein